MLAKLNAFSGSSASVNISTKKEEYTIKSREAKQREILTTQDINEIISRFANMRLILINVTVSRASSSKNTPSLIR